MSRYAQLPLTQQSPETVLLFLTTLSETPRSIENAELGAAQGTSARRAKSIDCVLVWLFDYGGALNLVFVCVAGCVDLSAVFSMVRRMID